LKGSEFAETTVEEIERMSEEGASSHSDLQFFLKYFLVANHVQRSKEQTKSKEKLFALNKVLKK
jgi:hypothetical protein